MPEKLSADVAVHERDGDGELLPITKTITAGGDEYEIDVLPAPAGERNRWLDRLEDEGAELSDEFVEELLDQFVDDPTLDALGVNQWSDLRPSIYDAIGETTLAVVLEQDDDDPFADALEERQVEHQGNPD